MATLTLLVVLLAIFGSLPFVAGEPDAQDYWARRAKFLKQERARMLGGNLTIELKEQAANEVLMRAKLDEIDAAYQDPSKFLPSQSFFLAADKIRESPVFKMIRSMPKGAVLHAHDMSIVSSDYVISNLTYRPNLYVCETEAGGLKLHFFDVPDKNCDWKLLEEVRKNDTTIDDRIRSAATLNTKEPQLAYPNVDVVWEKFNSLFDFFDFITYRPIYEDHFYQGLLEFYNDNIQYLELRTILPTLYDLNGTTYEKVEVAKIYKKVADRFMNDHPDFVGVKLIFAPLRKINEVNMEDYLETARQLKKELPDFIAGFDLVGQEDKGEPLVDFAEKLRALGDDVQVFFHAGETKWYGTSTDQNLVDAVLLNTKRIGHGYALLKHPKVMEMVREKNIAIEVSPISNQVLALVEDLRNHPAAALFADNYPVVVSNDDPGLWGAEGLSYDFYEAFVGIMSRNADIRALKKLALNSIEYSSMSTEQRKRAMELFDRRWMEFIDKLSASANTKSR